MKLVFMKLVLLLISIGLITFGSLTRQQTVSVSGAILFVLILAINLVWIYRSSKRYHNTNELEKPIEQNISGKIAGCLEGIIIFLGLIAMVVDNKKDYGLFVPGMIIWIGAIMIYFFGGMIIKYVTGIPLKFGYGGWYVSRRQRRH